MDKTTKLLLRCGGSTAALSLFLQTSACKADDATAIPPVEEAWVNGLLEGDSSVMVTSESEVASTQFGRDVVVGLDAGRVIVAVAASSNDPSSSGFFVYNDIMDFPADVVFVKLGGGHPAKVVAGDLNGDDRLDILGTTGAASNGLVEDRVYGYLGPFSEDRDGRGDIAWQDPADNDGEFGLDLVVGDLNNDGMDDAVLQRRPRPGYSGNSGVAYYQGPFSAGEIVYSDNDMFVEASSATGLGSSIAIDELEQRVLIGALTESRIYVADVESPGKLEPFAAEPGDFFYYGSRIEVVPSVFGSDSMGVAVLDVGFGDRSGAVQLLGRDGREMARLVSTHAGDFFGASLCADDFDGDGQVDLAVGAPFDPYLSLDDTWHSGYVAVFKGPISSGEERTVENADSLLGVEGSGGFGTSVACEGGLLVVGAPHGSFGEGAVYVHRYEDVL